MLKQLTLVSSGTTGEATLDLVPSDLKILVQDFILLLLPNLQIMVHQSIHYMQTKTTELLLTWK